MDVSFITNALEFLQSVLEVFYAWINSIGWVTVWAWIGVVASAVGLFWYIFRYHWGGTD